MFKALTLTYMQCLEETEFSLRFMQCLEETEFSSKVSQCLHGSSTASRSSGVLKDCSRLCGNLRKNLEDFAVSVN